MKYLSIALLLFIITGCQDEFNITTVAKENITFIKSNNENIKEIIRFSQDVYERNKSRDIDISIITCDEVSCSQISDSASLTYCLGKNWMLNKQLAGSFGQQKEQIADSISLTKIQAKMDPFEIGRIEIKNNNLEFHFDNHYSSYIIFDLEKNVDFDTLFEQLGQLKHLERPCELSIGKGFTIKFVRLEHGIS